MGRYTQRKMRGGGANAAAPAALPVITSISFGPTSYTVIFDLPISIDSALVPDSGLQLGGLDVSSVAVVNPVALDISTAGFMTSGLPWSMNSQPAWLLTAVLLPQAGTVS